jgi:hypothetical protein
MDDLIDIRKDYLGIKTNYLGIKTNHNEYFLLLLIWISGPAYTYFDESYDPKINNYIIVLTIT